MAASFSDLQKELLQLLRPTFPGPEITDALCNAEQLVAKHNVSLDDKQMLEVCAAEAIELTLMEMQGERKHSCPEEESD